MGIIIHDHDENWDPVPSDDRQEDRYSPGTPEAIAQCEDCHWRVDGMCRYPLTVPGSTARACEPRKKAKK